MMAEMSSSQLQASETLNPTPWPLYDDLDLVNREIRVLHISPSKDLSAPVECTIHKVLHEGSKRENYYALSYVWGPTSSSSHILINGTSKSTTKNLESALRHLRKEDETLIIWADAICINQEDQKEKSHQVSMMADIYRNAETVMVWLGESEEGDDSELAMSKITSWGNPSLQGDVKVLLGLISDGKYDDKDWLAVDKLLTRPYWHRRWIFQELLLAKTANVHCGVFVTPWVNFRGLGESWYQVLRKVNYLPLSPYSQDIIKNSKISILGMFTSFEEDNKWNTTNKSFLSLLRGTEGMQCTNDRDHIYSLMGLAGDVELYPQPDYGKSVEEIYTEFAEANIKITGNLDIIGEAALRLHDKNSGSNGLPSWVPDWRIEPKGAALNRSPSLYNACSGLPQTNEDNPISIHNEAIHVNGMVLDTVELVHNFSLDNYAQIIFCIISGITAGNDPTHPSGFPILNVLFKTLVLDHEYRLRGPNPTTLTEEEIEAPDIYFQLVQCFLLLLCFQWGYLIDLISPGQEETVMFQLNLRFLKNPDDVDARYHKFTSLKSFREAVRNEYMLEKEKIDFALGFLNEFQEPAEVLTKDKILFQTENDFLGLASGGIKQGDLVVVLEGCKEPVLLRKRSDKDGYFLAGDAFVYGVMRGENVAEVCAAAGGKGTMERFSIY